MTDLLDALAREVGPRVSTQGKILPGLSITEYPFLRDQFAEPLPEAAGAGAAEALSDLEAGAEAEDLRL